jgi:alpha-tubulin suppressor-like RCC1 family protein
MGSDLPILNTGGGVTQLAAGRNHFCAVLSGGIMKCWGDNFMGQLGIGSTNDYGGFAGNTIAGQAAVNLGTSRTAVSISAGGEFSCAVLDNGDAKCWGDNSDGQLSLGDKTPRGTSPPTMGDSLQAINPGSGSWVGLTGSGESMCGLRNNGTVSCFGLNSNGTLGLGLLSEAGLNPGSMGANLPYLDLGSNLISSIGISASHACAVVTDGRVKCWGSNSFGQLGLGDTSPRGQTAATFGSNLQPVNLGVGLTAVKVATGGGHSCAMFNDGRLKCWGRNTDGQLGLGTTGNRGTLTTQMGDSLPFVSLGSGRTAVDVTLGDNYSCALLDNSQVKCWGAGAYGVLGYQNSLSIGLSGGMGDALAPVNLGSGQFAAAIETGPQHTCALLTNGDLKCWGNGSSARLGKDGTANIGHTVNTMGDFNLPIFLGFGVSSIGLGGGHSCAILDNSTLKCWGQNNYGQLGQGSNALRGSNNSTLSMTALAPISLRTGFTPVQVQATAFSTCALSSAGEILCWGSNFSGELGTQSGSTNPVGVTGGTMGNNLLFTPVR